MDKPFGQIAYEVGSDYLKNGIAWKDCTNKVKIRWGIIAQTVVKKYVELQHADIHNQLAQLETLKNELTREIQKY